MRFAKTLTTAFVAALVIGAGAAEAKTVSLAKQVSNNSFGAENWYQKVTRTIVTQGKTKKVKAGAFRLTDGINDFITFCIEPGIGIDLSKAYTVTEKATVSENIDRLYGAAYHDVKDALTASAFQVALWEVVAETSKTLNVFANNHRVADVKVGLKANEFLSRMATADTGQYRYTIYSNSGQDQLQASPVPLPASALLLIGGLGGMAALRRKKA